MPGRLGIDLSAVSVLSYLESYPYPSFALLIPVPPSNLTSSYGGAASSGSAGSLEDLPFTRGQTTPIKAFDIVWSNSRWKTLVKDRPLLDCLDVQGARALGDWLSGAKELRARNRRISSSTASQTTSDKEELAGAAPEGFWESEIGYEDHSPSKRVDNVIPEGEDERVVEEANEMLPTLTLDLVGPIKVTLELTKTAISPNEYLRGGLISTATTHTSGITKFTGIGGTTDHSESDSSTSVATTIKPKFEPKTTILSEPSSTPSTLSRPTLAASILDPEMAKNGTAAAIDFDYSTITPQPDRPLFFNRDGTVTRPKPRTERTDPKGKSSDIHVLFETTDWSKTPLGPRESWPPSLKTIVSVLLAYPSPLCIWWGPELTLLYNQPFSASVEKHPDVFGVSGAVAWAEIWDQLGPLSELVMSGTTMWREDEFFLLKNKNSQGGQLYECYHTWSWLPIRQEDGTVGGLWNSNVDSTKKVLVDRRLATTREIGEQSAIARTTREFHSAVIDVLGANPRDIPFAAMYQVTVPTETGKGESHPPATIKVNLTRTGSVGVPEDDPSSPSHLAFSLRPAPRSVGSNDSTNPRPRSPTLSVASSLSVPSMSPLAFQDDQQLPGCTQWPFREALQTRRMVLVENCAELVKNFPIREWDELPNAAVVIPIANDSDQGVPPAVLTVGLNVRRPFDDDYENFLHLLRVQLASGIAAARSYEAEKQRIDDLAALDRAKSLLFSNISHELRTPLTLIAGPLDDLLQVNQDPRQKEWLTLARSNTRRLTRLVGALMDVSRLEAGKLKGSFRAVNLGIVTRDLAGQFAAAFQKAKLEYVVDCDTSPHTTYVDIEQWEKIVFNLLGNAMKYTLHGTVIVSFTYSDTQAVLAVKDTGVGIPASDINLIGERFHRVASTSRSHEGTGIGLALVKELVKLHGGALEVESATAAEGANGAHGSTFRVRIPLGSEHLPSDALDHDDSTLTRTVNIASYGRDIINEATLWNKNIESSGDSASDDSSPLGTSVESITMSNIRGAEQSLLYFEKTDIVLIVDDSFDTRKYLSSMFAPYCVVVEARDGQEALDKCMQIRPDLIITDVMMPVLDGFGLLRALKQSDELKAIPVIMVTAHDGDEAKVEALLGGADDYMVKPFNVRELIARAHVQLLLGKKRRQLEMAFKEQTLELRAVSEYSPGGIFRASDQGVIGFANDAWYKMSGYPVGIPVADWDSYIVEDHRPHVHEFWDALFTDEEPTTRPVEFQYKTGRWVSIKLVKLETFGTGLPGMLGCATDITDRIAYEEEQKARIREADMRRLEAEEAKRQQELLIDITSHEIRNPISSFMQTNLLTLQEQLEMVIKNQTSFHPTSQLLNNIEEDLEALESIYQCGLAQERICNDVLSLGKIQLDKLQMFDVETSIRHEGKKIMSIFQNEARMKRITLSLKIGESLSELGIDLIKTDPVRLGQVMTNLMSNGIRFTSTSAVRRMELRFDLSLEPPDEGTCAMPQAPKRPIDIEDGQPIYLYVAVTDTGPGLTPKELNLLFQRFSQVSPKTHTVFGGSGLGLFVCRKITDIMGGRIEVVSQRGQGSTFRFFIEARTCKTQSPYKELNDPEISDLAKKKKRKMSGPSKRLMGFGKPPHVLIVEDNLINQTVLARQLRHVGLTCEVASDGLQALAKIRAVSTLQGVRKGQYYDCVLMDVEMPVMDGLTAVRHIRAEEAAGTLGKNLVIALTGNARQGQIDHARASGMDDVIIKPYRLDLLLEKIEEMMKIRERDRSLSAGSEHGNGGDLTEKIKNVHLDDEDE